jgi:aminoglycoside phosphotransferase (APT) family kinase protein
VQVKQWDISSVWRAVTSAGHFYFKATPTLFAHEPRVTSGLARLFPDHVPAPTATAIYPDQGWMLLPSFEGSVMWEPTLAQKEDVLRIAARMQVEASLRIPELLAMGGVDSRLHTLPARVDALLSDDAALTRLTAAERDQLSSLRPRIEETCARLAAGPVPQTLMHGDLHGGNVAVHNGRYTIFDWTDACITHPFFDLVTFLQPTDPRFEHLRDVYLSEWASRANLDTSLDDLRSAFDAAYHLGGLHHALNYYTINANCEPPMVAEFEGAVETFVRHFLSSQS